MMVIILLILSLKPLGAYRPLEGESKPGPVDSGGSTGTKVPFQRGPVPPSMPSTCTYIGYPVEPGHEGRHCEIHG
ncbi:hypothetical protein TorRG33x02_092590 [Trema orientale]|uniref:Transmembrane protein n=1 Tax=Trema orientale TaxID=63057 RepID=A0A2P5FB94_TREOI|nr:hypothetical protein TorRG33x02_092590 [Trema orientale]